MLNKIKDKFIHILRKHCGYYELERKHISLKFYNNDIEKKYYINYKKYRKTEVALEKLSARHEAKILEYDILDNKYKKIVNVYTNCSTLNNHYDTEEIIKVGERENSYLYKKYLVAELEEILNSMKEKGIHPQDLINRIINRINVGEKFNGK